MYKVLIADDEVEIRNGLYQFAWENIGFTAVGRVSNGLEALEFMRSNAVDAVLCDVRMPVMDGLEFARALQQKQTGVKIVFLSGYNDFDYVRQAMKYGGKDYLLKPTRFKQLEEVFLQIRKELDDELFERYSSLDGKDSVYDNRMVQYAVKYIQEHLSKISLEAVSAFVHVSPQYFSRFFKEKTGVNFSDYVMEQRMMKSAEMLKDLRNKTYEVAAETGYSNPKNFTRAFKAYFGVSPSVYRERVISEENN